MRLVSLGKSRCGRGGHARSATTLTRLSRSTATPWDDYADDQVELADEEPQWDQTRRWDTPTDVELVEGRDVVTRNFKDVYSMNDIE